MKQTFLQQLMLYRYRYIIGYGLFVAILGSLLLCQLDTIPFGLTDNDMQSAVTSATLPLSSAASPIDLPFHLLQKASVSLFGTSTLGIKLPAVLIGILSGIGLLLLLGRWFRANVAILSSLLAITSSLFLISSRGGDASIMLIFWPIYILLFATLISQEVKLSLLYKFLLALCVALSLYTPLMVYPLVAAAVAMLIHPHLRYILRSNNLGQVVLETMLALLAFTPLGWLLYNHPSDITHLFGWPDNLPTLLDYTRDIWSLISNIGNFISPHISTIIVPTFSVGMLVLILLGLMRTFLDHHATRSHFLLIWLALLLPIAVLNSQTLALLYVPMILLLTIGLETLIREWYKLFPRNPYARIGALFPLGLLMITLLSFNYTSYFYGLGYSSQASAYYNNDLSDLRQALHKPSVNTASMTLVGSNQSSQLFDLLRREYPTLTLSTPSTLILNPNQKGSVIIASDQQAQLNPAIAGALGQPTSFVVNAHAQDALRFRIYTRW